MAAKKKKKKVTIKKIKKSRPKKKVAKKKATARKKSKKTSKKGEIPAKRILGAVTHYFPHVRAAVIKLKKPISVGDTILIKGSTTNFKQRVDSMQIDHVSIQKAKKGDEIGLQVKDRVREHDLVLLPE
jgi:putative protease